eukprot:c20517_g3_i1.p1 GENE.c20517_g3_i1~~c20517_g3_i1.p1  ORF type:complete len:358 (-),score=156.24 c20517_g3_i1:104-1177(-)
MSASTSKILVILIFLIFLIHLSTQFVATTPSRTPSPSPSPLINVAKLFAQILLDVYIGDIDQDLLMSFRVGVANTLKIPGFTNIRIANYYAIFKKGTGVGTSVIEIEVFYTDETAAQNGVNLLQSVQQLLVNLNTQFANNPSVQYAAIQSYEITLIVHEIEDPIWETNSFWSMAVTVISVLSAIASVGYGIYKIRKFRKKSKKVENRAVFMFSNDDSLNNVQQYGQTVSEQPITPPIKKPIIPITIQKQLSQKAIQSSIKKSSTHQENIYQQEEEEVNYQQYEDDEYAGGEEEYQEGEEDGYVDGYGYQEEEEYQEGEYEEGYEEQYEEGGEYEEQYEEEGEYQEGEYEEEEYSGQK